MAINLAEKFGTSSGGHEGDASFTTRAGESAEANFMKVISALDPQPEDLQKAGDYLKEKTRSQALSGFDVNNKPFAPYSPLYAKRKGQTNVDLYGNHSVRHMLDAVEARVQVDPPLVEVGIMDDPELAMRGRIHNEGLVATGARAMAFISSLKHRTRQKIAGLKRQLSGKGGIHVIPQRRWLAVTRQDLKIMAEIIGDSIVQRLNRSNQ